MRRAGTNPRRSDGRIQLVAWNRYSHQEDEIDVTQNYARLFEIRNQMLGLPAPWAVESMTLFEDTVNQKLEEQMQAIEAGDYEKANAIGSLVNNMMLMAISFNITQRR